MPKRRGRPYIRAAAVFSAGVLLCAAAMGVAFVYMTAPAESRGGVFSVQKGESASAIARDLESRGYIRSAAAFTLLVRLEGGASNLQAGTYRIEPGMGARDILEMLKSGRQAMIKLTVPEGLTIRQIAELVQELGITNKDEFLAAARSRALLAELGIPGDSAEGYLFPDTYFFSAGFPAENLIRTMAAAFFSRIGEFPEAGSLSQEELRERVIIASIVEREYKDPDEAPLMASVFYNRLKIGMALQSCATVVYVMTEIQGKPHPEVLRDRDLKIPSLYNTYAQRGLPPGPIANPGITALDAAFRPAKTPYLYFRLTDEASGRHHFSATLDEHIDARRLSVKRSAR